MNYVKLFHDHYMREAYDKMLVFLDDSGSNPLSVAATMTEEQEFGEEHASIILVYEDCKLPSTSADSYDEFLPDHKEHLPGDLKS